MVAFSLFSGRFVLVLLSGPGLHVGLTCPDSSASGRKLSLFFPTTLPPTMSDGSVIRGQEQHKIFIASVSGPAVSFVLSPVLDRLSDGGDLLDCPSFCLGSRSR